jgi:hypothetical protein
MLWQQCFLQLIVGGSAFAGTTVLLVQVLPSLLNGSINRGSPLNLKAEFSLLANVWRHRAEGGFLR